ncbi:hypothetical protein FAES_0041 [Fibrella aestuarina BUZ 2]|uniref:DUF4595 domain-containing protein n=1 Tax=Fibrella aestuarina BUZ 2 TaxID=1166018 RepID=I0K1Q2_9BACT|nr:hypothetical protein [Fibrella aestuarina]CCG98055.1 hypothetical protein FAES_0041 [Fibrella aestuarina BUZ 2]
MRAILRTVSLLIWSAFLPGCGTDYSILSDKVPPQQKPQPEKEPEKTLKGYRIKRIVYEGDWAAGATTEFTYGNNGKVNQATYVGQDVGRGAPKGLFAYNAGNQLLTYTYQYPYVDGQGTLGERTAFSYRPQSSGSGGPTVEILFAQTDFVKSDGTYQLLKHTTSTLVNGLVSTVRTEATTAGSAATTDQYTIESGNLTAIRAVSGPDQIENFTFDDKPNPFFGLFGPDVTPVRRYSRNNVTEATVRYSSGSVRTYTISYTYNEQGLPITAQTSNTSSRILFEYEAY